MIKRITSIALLCLLSMTFTNKGYVNVNAATIEQQQDFINALKKGAIEGYQKYNILPSITIAQGILESGWGNSDLAQYGNNLFGIKAYSDWQGEIVYLPTKEYNSEGISYTITAAFRHYDSYTQCIEDHNLLLNNKRYERLRNATNYVDACYAIYDCGYATAPNYAEQLISVIEKYELYNYDTEEINKKKTAEDNASLINYFSNVMNN